VHIGEANAVREVEAWRFSGFLGVAVTCALVILTVWSFAGGVAAVDPGRVVAAIILLVATGMIIPGHFVADPNEGRVLVFLGRYVGSVRQAGFWWSNPLARKRHVSLRVRNFNSEKLKVNDALGNPIEIAAVVVWRVVDTAKALFDVEDYETFVAIQSETAIRTLASRHPYDAHEAGTVSLRGNPDEVADDLRREVRARLEIAGVEIMEARLSHLAYAPEIAQAMLRRQQAQAIIAARQKIVEGAVGMVDMALRTLSAQGVVELDEDKKATMVNNLLVALVSEHEAHPVINTGTLFS
jgi:hypothetical protein